MNKVLILEKNLPKHHFFKVSETECSDEDYKRYTDICDSYYYSITIEETYTSLHFGYSNTDTTTKNVDIPYSNILVKNGEVVGFLYDTSQTPNGYEDIGAYEGRLVFLLSDEGKSVRVGGYASVGCNSSSETCRLLKR